MKVSDIHCPACRWKPGTAARWSCLPRCGTLWNTFATGGLCPGCGARWHRTQCLSCGVVSPHRDWYHDPQPRRTDDSTRERELVER